MQFIFHPQAGNNTIELQGEQYIHLYKSRRTKQFQTLNIRNLADDYLYTYNQGLVTRSNAILHLEKMIFLPNKPRQNTHIILSVIHSKSIQKMLPFLNELGVDQLSLFYADFSQQNEKMDDKKMQAILINSSQQCGRSNILKIHYLKNLQEVLELYPQINVFDFGGKAIPSKISHPILVGPEGGFSTKEKEILKSFPLYSTQENIILKSESACIFIASKLQG